MSGYPYYTPAGLQSAIDRRLNEPLDVPDPYAALLFMDGVLMHTVQKLLELHPMQRMPGWPSPSDQRCTTCHTEWPCLTVNRLIDALGAVKAL